MTWAVATTHGDQSERTCRSLLVMYKGYQSELVQGSNEGPAVRAMVSHVQGAAAPAKTA